MKKFLLIVAVAFASATYAQTEKGNWMVGSDLGLSFQSKNLVVKNDQVTELDQTVTTFKITPNFNYFVVHNLAVGLGVSYEHIMGLKENIDFCLENELDMVAFCH